LGGPVQYRGVELVSKMGLEARHFDRVSAILKETLEELKIGATEIEEVMQVIETTREAILNLLARQCWGGGAHNDNRGWEWDPRIGGTGILIPAILRPAGAGH